MIQNKAEILELVKQDGTNLRLAFWDLREDKEIVLEAVKNNPHSLQFAANELQDDIELLSYVSKNDSYYYHMLNPCTGTRYDIPMLRKVDPAYFYKYVDYMKMKEQSPDTFDKILRWD